MTRPASDASAGGSPAAAVGAPRVLVVVADTGVLHSIRQWAPELEARIEFVPDLPHAARQLSRGGGDAVVVALGDRPEDALAGWVDAVRGVPGTPHLIALVDRPSMGLAIRAEQLGVPDLLPLPMRRDDLAQALKRARTVESEAPMPLPEVGAVAEGQYALVGRSPEMLEVYKLIARVAPSTETVPVEVRLIAATNRDLKEAIAENRFREDLYYRLAVVTIRLPRLADRGDDLLLLTAYFARLFAERYKKEILTISDRAVDLLRGHPWIGNVRELRNVVERAVIVATGRTIRTEHLPDEVRAAEAELPDAGARALQTLPEAEARHIARVLAHTSGQIGAAADILGIHRNTLTRKMKEYGL